MEDDQIHINQGGQVDLQSTSKTCFDDIALDSEGNFCHWYAFNPKECGKYDTEEFIAGQMCCACPRQSFSFSDYKSDQAWTCLHWHYIESVDPLSRHCCACGGGSTQLFQTDNIKCEEDSFREAIFVAFESKLSKPLILSVDHKGKMIESEQENWFAMSETYPDQLSPLQPFRDAKDQIKRLAFFPREK